MPSAGDPFTMNGLMSWGTLKEISPEPIRLLAAVLMRQQESATPCRCSTPTPALVVEEPED